MALSSQEAVSDGTLDTLAVSLEFFSRSEITLTFNGIVAAEGAGWDWVSDTLISFMPDVPAGVTVKLQRLTDVAQVRHEFSEGAAFKATTLDEDFVQVLRVAQEQQEGAYSVKDIFNDIDMHGNSVGNLGIAVAAGDALPLGQATTLIAAADSGAVLTTLAAESGATLVGSDDGAGGTLWATVQGFADTLRSSSGGDTVGWEDPVAPAYLKTVSDIAAGLPVSVLRFIPAGEHSAIRDGSTTSDLDAYVQDGIDACSRLVLADGIILIANPLLMKSQFQMEGGAAGASILRASPSFTTSSYLDSMLQDPTSSSLLNRILLRNFQLDGQGAATFAAAMKLTGHYNSHFENLYIRQSKGFGQYLIRPVNGGQNNVYINAPADSAVRIIADSGTGQYDLGNLLMDNGTNVPGLYVTQTSQNKFSLFANAIRAENGWSEIVSVNSNTISTDNAIVFKCRSIRAETAPHASAVSPSVFLNTGRTMYEVGEVRLGGSASGWTNIVSDTTRNITKTASPVIGLNVGDLQFGHSVQIASTPTPNLGGRVGFGEAPTSGMIDVFAGTGTSGSSTEPAARFTQRSSVFAGSVVKAVADRSSSLSSFKLLELLSASTVARFSVLGSGAIRDLQTVNGPVGTITLAAAATTVGNNTAVTAASVIFLFPANAAAATLVSGAKSPYISAKVAGTSFTVATADGTAATGTEVFNYLLLN